MGDIRWKKFCPLALSETYNIVGNFVIKRVKKVRNASFLVYLDFHRLKLNDE